MRGELTQMEMERPELGEHHGESLVQFSYLVGTFQIGKTKQELGEKV